MLRRSTRSGANANQGAVKQGRGVIRPAPEANAKQAAAPANRPRASPRGATLLAHSGRLSAQTVSVTIASGPANIIAKPNPAGFGEGEVRIKFGQRRQRAGIAQSLANLI